ncbi:MAG: hypothetical protein JXL80_11730 [Planctomycetes bacterium]|nr:hypothetical protein [Planctomycetota bacterium]
MRRDMRLTGKSEDVAGDCVIGDALLVAVRSSASLENIVVTVSMPDRFGIVHFWHLCFWGVLRVDCRLGDSGEGPQAVHVCDDNSSDELPKWRNRMRSLPDAVGEEVHHVVLEPMPTICDENDKGLKGIQITCRSVEVRRGEFPG